MNFELKQYLKLTQQLVISPQLQQALKLLQLNHLELKQELENQLMENPCLEAALPSTNDSTVEELKTLIKTAIENTEGSFLGRGMYQGPDEVPSYEQVLSKPESLADYLHWQLTHTHLTPLQQAVSESILGNLDENGYLTQPIEDIAEKCQAPLQEAEAVLFIMQQLDPIGVASRDLRECLLNQLWALHLHTPTVQLAEKILESYFDLFLKRSLVTLERKLRLPRTQIAEACQFLSQLNPKPGSTFTEISPHQDSINPDIYVVKMGNQFRIVLNDDGLPKLKVSRQYLKLLDGTPTKADVAYVQDKIKNAMWLINCIGQRQQSIRKVAESLLIHQKAFFEKGPNYIVPLILRQVAQDVGLHESTISRVTRNKYMQTPFGLFELKFFFNTPVATAKEDVGTRIVKIRIQSLIAHESSDHPLTDIQLQQALAQQDIHLARRTIAKYREMLGILPSPIRKKQFSY